MMGLVNEKTVNKDQQKQKLKHLIRNLNKHDVQRVEKWVSSKQVELDQKKKLIDD